MDNVNLEKAPSILSEFADKLGTQVVNGRIYIPENFGSGYCAGFVFNEKIRILIVNYELNNDIIIENPEIDKSKKLILFKFYNLLTGEDIKYPVKNSPAVLIATSRINTDGVIPIPIKTAAINIEIDAEYLNSIFSNEVLSPKIKDLLQNEKPILFERLLNPAIKKVVDEIIDCIKEYTIKPNFENYFLRIKSEELICRLLNDFDKINDDKIYPINSQDIRTIFKIKELLLENLAQAPTIVELSKIANMSPTKLKRLFKQIFGDSIFSYYSKYRINEAARLLKEGNFPVSEVGYLLGFTNLSHFSRIFKERIGVNPKKFSQL